MKQPITNIQTEILLYLYKFRFLTVRHIQQLLNHQTPDYTQKLLKDLTDNNYIATIKFPTGNAYADNAKPNIYHLLSKSRQVLKNHKVFDMSFFQRVYTEKKKTESFVRLCLNIASAYLFFLSKKKPDESLHFLTESDLVRFDYLPDPLPSAYIAVKGKRKTKRYFLQFFYSYAKAGILRASFRNYLDYANDGFWEANEPNKELPTLLFVCPSQRLKNHIMHYAKGVFAKEYEEKLRFFVTSEKRLLHGGGESIWEKVTIVE